MLSPVGVLCWLDDRLQQGVDASAWWLKRWRGITKQQLHAWLWYWLAGSFVVLMVVDYTDIGTATFRLFAGCMYLFLGWWNENRPALAGGTAPTVREPWFLRAFWLGLCLLHVFGMHWTLVDMIQLSMAVAWVYKSYLYNTPEDPPPKKKAKEADVSSLIPSFQAP